jgi:hypothetical protein
LLRQRGFAKRINASRGTISVKYRTYEVALEPSPAHQLQSEAPFVAASRKMGLVLFGRL